MQIILSGDTALIGHGLLFNGCGSGDSNLDILNNFYNNFQTFSFIEVESLASIEGGMYK